MSEQLKQILAQLERLCNDYPNSVAAFQVAAVGVDGLPLCAYTLFVDADAPANGEKGVIH